MNKKIVGILVCLLFVGVGVFPSISAGSEDYVKEKLSESNLPILLNQPTWIAGWMREVSDKGDYIEIKTAIAFIIITGYDVEALIPNNIYYLWDFEGIAKEHIVIGTIRGYSGP